MTYWRDIQNLVVSNSHCNWNRTMGLVYIAKVGNRIAWISPHVSTVIVQNDLPDVTLHVGNISATPAFVVDLVFLGASNIDLDQLATLETPAAAGAETHKPLGGACCEWRGWRLSRHSAGCQVPGGQPLATSWDLHGRAGWF